MHAATLLLIVLGAGLASQWLAWRMRLPAIVVLIAAGLLLGPMAGAIDITMAQAEADRTDRARASRSSCSKAAWT